MSTSYSYTTLKSTLISFTEDTGTEFASAVDLIIPLAEDKVLRDLDLEIFDVVGTGTFTATNPIITKPTGIVALRSLHYTVAATGSFVQMDQKSWEFIKDYWPVEATTTATPKYYTEYSATEWYVAGTPSASVTAWTSRYIKRPIGLTSDNATTWLGTNAGDVLLYACLVVSEQFLKGDGRVPVWKAEYMERLGAARNELRRVERADYSPIDAAPVKD